MITLVGNIWTSDGTNQLTAVNGGGLGPNNSVALNTNRTVASTWETFNLILLPGSPPIGPGMKFALQTSDGTNYLTAVNGGGMGGPNNATCPIHTNQTNPGPWETFVLQVNNNAVPVTAQISSYTPGAGPFFLTAVNGGGIGDGGTNTTPVHTDTKSIGPWEQFSFQGSVVNSGPIIIPCKTNVDIDNPLGGVFGNIAGTFLLTLAPNGGWSYLVTANNSVPFVSYNYVLAVVVVGADRTGYSFAASGQIGAAPFGNNNIGWVQAGNNAKIQSNWDGSLGRGYSYYWNASATVAWDVLLNQLVSDLQTAGTIIGDAIDVVSYIAG